MVKTRFTIIDQEQLALVVPVGPDGHEVPLHLVFYQVICVAHLTQQDCCLDTIIDNLDERPDA